MCYHLTALINYLTNYNYFSWFGMSDLASAGRMMSEQGRPNCWMGRIVVQRLMFLLRIIPPLSRKKLVDTFC